MAKLTDEKLLNDYKIVYDNYGRQPSYNEYSEFAKLNKLASLNTLKNRFGNIKNIHVILGLPKKENSQYTKEFLLSELKRFESENGKPPTSVDLDKKNTGYPSRKTYVKYFNSFGDALFEAGFEFRNIETFLRTKPLPKGIKRFTKEMIKNCIDEFINIHNRVPSLKEIESVPNYPIRADFRKLYGSYNEAIKDMGYVPANVHQYTDNELEDAIFKFYMENDRPPSILEFNNSEYPSFWCYQNRFGSWSKALVHYGLETYAKNINDLTNDIEILCKWIYDNEGRKTITYSDIDNSDFCSSIASYTKHFRKSLNMTVREYVRSIGFNMPPSGCGMYYEFDNGEETFSTYEYKVTKYLRRKGLIYNSDYFRSVKYNSFIGSYSGNMDCDYMIVHKNVKYYIEVAGMMDKYKTTLSNKLEVMYAKKMNIKEGLLKQVKCKYLIIYPNDFKEKSLEEIFSFLHN